MATKTAPATPTKRPNVAPIEALAGFIEDEAYQSDQQSLPYLQFLNDQDPGCSGLFITTENMEASGFIPDATWTQHQAKFKNATVEGYRTLTPRLAIVRQTGLLMYDRATRDYLGQYQKDEYNRATHVLKTRYLVFVLGEDNKPLHASPMMMTTKGSVCGSFGQNLKAFRDAVNALTKKRMGYRFHALWAFCSVLRPELKGSGSDTSWVTSIDSVDLPNPENYACLFLGSDEDTKLLIENAFDEYEDFGQLSQTAPAGETAPATPVEPTEPIPMDEMLGDVVF